MVGEAMKKLQAEINADQKNKYLAVVGAFMMRRIQEHPEDAAAVMTDGKTLAGSLGAMKVEAQKNQANGVGVLSDDEGFAIVLQYYGIAVPQAEMAVAVPAAPSFDVDLDALLE